MSEHLQAELDECMDTIKWSAESLSRESLEDLKKTSRPAGIVKDVLEAVSILLGTPETKWEKLRTLLASAKFVERVQKLDFQRSVTREQFQKLCEKLQNPEFDEEHIKTVCVPVVPFAIWCRAIGVVLSSTKYRGSTEIRPVAAAGAASRREVPRAFMQPVSHSELVVEPNLGSLSPEKLRCVEELTVSRPQVGKVTFHGETDCTGLDLDRLVRLELGEVLVYPDSSHKPPVGMGLNKPATVTMYQCFPPSGSKLLKDARSQERYKAKIKQMTEEKHARFIDYDCATGVWTFSVEHF